MDPVKGKRTLETLERSKKYEMTEEEIQRLLDDKVYNKIRYNFFMSMMILGPKEDPPLSFSNDQK